MNTNSYTTPNWQHFLKPLTLTISNNVDHVCGLFSTSFNVIPSALLCAPRDLQKLQTQSGSRISFSHHNFTKRLEKTLTFLPYKIALMSGFWLLLIITEPAWKTGQPENLGAVVAYDSKAQMRLAILERHNPGKVSRVVRIFRGTGEPTIQSKNLRSRASPSSHRKASYLLVSWPI